MSPTGGRIRAGRQVPRASTWAWVTDGLVVNVGAGTGSYEPSHCAVVAVEPSVVMLAQRPAGAAPAAACQCVAPCLCPDRVRTSHWRS